MQYTAASLEKRVLIATDRAAAITRAEASLANLSLEAFGGNRVALARRAIAIAFREQVDLLLVGHINYAPLGMVLRALQPSLRYGVIVHGVEVWTRLTLLKRWALQRADFVMAVSEFTKAKVVEFNGVEQGRIRIVPNTIEWTGDSDEDGDGDTERNVATLLTPLQKPADPFLLSVCRLEASEKYKGIDTVINALPAVIARVPEVQYLVVGSGSDLERHKRLAAAVGVADRVHFLGSVDDATLRRCYRECDVFVLPSDGEGFGIVYLEAMYYGRPVIATNSRAVPEVVKHNESGLLVEYGNAEQLSEAIVSLSRDRSRRDKMGDAGRELLRRSFSFEHFKRKFHELILSELKLGLPHDKTVIRRNPVSADP